MAWRHRRGRAQQEQPQLSSPQPEQVHTAGPCAHPGAHVPMAVCPQMCHLPAQPHWLSHGHVSLTGLSHREDGQRSLTLSCKQGPP